MEEIESGRRLESVCEKRPAEGDAGSQKQTSVGEKRVVEGDVSLSKEGPPMKRIKGAGLIVNVKKVAEAVLVLSAMGKMRGGRRPTAFEKNLMVDARGRLTKLCEGLAPKDVFPTDAFGLVIEDLGLNKLKEQRLEFRPPKISIAEKLMISKRKMDKLGLSASAPHSSRPAQKNSGVATEIRGTFHTARMSQPFSNHVPVSSGSFQSVAPVGHVNPASSTSLPYQLPSSQIRPVVSSEISSNYLGAAALPRVDKPHLILYGKQDSSRPSQIKANYSANSTFRTPTWSVQPQSVLLAKTGTDNKVPLNMSFKVEGAASSRPVINQMTVLPNTKHVQSMNFRGNSHVEICRIVQRLLQPSVLVLSTWDSPSREYMNKALTCQMCLHMLTEIENILVCDACEKGFHLKCLHTTTPQKGVPRGEWHCGKCFLLNNGKPLPPKYGRVMRNTNAPEVSSNAAAASSSSNKKVGASDERVDQQKMMVSGNPSVQNVPSSRISINNSHLKAGLSGPVTEAAKGIQGKILSLSVAESSDETTSRPCQNGLGNSSSATFSPLTNFSGGKSSDSELVESELNDPAKSEVVPGPFIHSQYHGNPDDGSGISLPNKNESQPKTSSENHVMHRDSENCHGEETSSVKLTQLNEPEVSKGNPTETLTTRTGNTGKGRSSSDGLPDVDWVGGAIQVSDEKTHYKSCCINGRIHEVLDYVLIHDNDRLIPSKLQAMWEDNKTRMKWVMVNRCYFPADLPETVGRPCGLERSEVYESSCLSTITAGLIECPCEVLPPRKYAEENERRIQSGMQLNDHSEPLYVCKWVYDETKGLFRDVSC